MKRNQQWRAECAEKVHAGVRFWTHYFAAPGKKEAAVIADEFARLNRYEVVKLRRAVAWGGAQ